MITMLADTKLMQIKMEELLSFGKEKSFYITQDRSALFAIREVEKKRHGNNTKK